MRNLLCSVVVAVACVAQADETSVYEVKAGETLTVTDENVDQYAGGISFADSTGIVEFNTSAAPTMEITGSGTVKKTSASTWYLSKHLPNFKGVYDLTAGTTIFCPPSTSKNSYLGNADYGAVYVRDGADLHLLAYNNDGGASDSKNYPLNIRLWSKPIHIAGTGPNGLGALVSTNRCQLTDNGFLGNLIVDDAATIGLQNTAYFYMESVTLTGHDLTIQGKGEIYLAYGGTLTGEGTIILQPDAANGKPTLGVRTYTIAASETSGIRLKGATLALLHADHAPATRNRPIWCEENASIIYQNYWTSTDLSWEKRVSWSGPIDIAEGKTLTVSASHANRLFVLEGGITGAGKLATGCGSHHTVCVKGTPAFTGSFYYNYNSHYTLLAPFSGSDCAITHYNVGTEDDPPYPMQVYSNQVLWTWAEAVKAANAAVWISDKFPTFGGWAEILGDEASAPVELTPCTLTKPIGATVPMTFTAPQTASDGLVDFRWYRGSATLTGGRDKTINLGAFVATTQIGDMWANGVSVTDVTIATTETNRYQIGCNDQHLGRLSISNAVWSVKDPFNRTDYAAVGLGGFRVGAYGVGELRIEKDSVVTNLFTIAGGGETTMSEGQGQGAVIQNGGKVYALGSTTNHETSSIGAGGSLGYYEMNGGTLEAQKMFQIGGYGIGNFVLNAGEAVWNSTLHIGCCNGGSGILRVRGGSVEAKSVIEMRGTYQDDNSFALLAVEGPQSTVKSAGRIAGNTHYASVNKNGLLPRPMSAAIVRDGGTIEANFFGCTYGAFDVGFDGGTFVATTYSEDIFKGWYAKHLDVTVYKGGLTVQVDDSRGPLCAAPIKGATGKGVKAIALPEITGTIVAAPVINITGDGHGAIAACEFDSTTHTVTGVTILSPGCDYTCVTALVYYADGNQLVSTGNNKETSVPKLMLTSAAGEIELADNVNSGSFTKTGTGSLYLKATNEWVGATTVAGGALVCSCDWALPKGTDIVLKNNALMNFGGATNEIGSITYGAGGGRIGGQTMTTIPVQHKLTISTEEIAAENPILFSCNWNLANMTSFTLTGDVAALDYEAHPELCEKRLEIIKVNNGTLIGDFDLSVFDSIVTAYPNWKAHRRASSVYLRYSHGMTLLVR